MRGAACVGLVCLVVLGCGGDDDGGGVDPALTITQVVGPMGGTVELVGGGKVTIPAGALNESTSIKITKLELEDVAALPSNMEAAGKPYAFEPHGKMFLQNVTIEVPFEGADNEVRPLKLDDEDDTSWQTIFPSEKDTAGMKLSMETTSFSVILAARPLRNTGVVTLPDGAILEDAGDSGGTGGEDAGGTGGEDAGGTGGTGGVDGGMVNSGPCDATAVAVSAITLPTPGYILNNGSRTFITTSQTILTAYTGSGTSLTSAGDLITLNAAESFNDVATGGSIVAAVTNGGSLSGRVAIAPVAGGNTTFYDLINYTEYGAFYDNRPMYAYAPTANHVATDGNVVAVSMTTGALVLFSPAGQPLGFIHNVDFNQSPVGGATAMVVSGNHLIVAIDRMGINVTTLRAIRVFDISTPGNITQVDEVVRTDQPYTLIADTARSRFLMSNLAGGQVIGFSVGSDGTIGADTLVATGIAGAQARSMAITGDLLLLGNPNFSAQPVDFGVSVFGLVGTGSVSRGVIDLPDGDYSVTASASDNFYYSGSTMLNTIDLSSCL